MAGGGQVAQAWFGPRDEPALRDFFAVYATEIRVDELLRDLVEEDATFRPVCDAILAAWTPEVQWERRATLTLAIAGNWEPYERSLRSEAVQYANFGVRHWEQLTRIIARRVTAKLVERFVADPPRLTNTLVVMGEFLSRMRETVAQAYREKDEAQTRATEIALAELQAKHAADDRFRMYLEASPDGVVICGPDGRIELVNKQVERMFGYDRAEVLGQPMEVLIPDRFRGERPELRRRFTPGARQTGSGLSLVGRRKDGTDFPIEVSLSPLETERGFLVTSTIRDISERRRTENALRQANRELEAFSYSVAHDLRTPLRGMNGFAKILLDDYADKLDADGKSYLQLIGANALRMGETIDALLELARVVRAELRTERTDLSALAHEILGELRIAEPHRQVEVAVAPGLIADIDPVLARTLFANLLGNAWKFTSRAQNARIEVGRIQGGLFVRDNGTGFDMEHAAKLFVPFQRLHSAKEFPGTGIGLATAQRILDRHGGRIWAEGSPLQGATFFLALPGLHGEPR